MQKKSLKSYVFAGCVALAAGACSFSAHGAEKDAQNEEIERKQNARKQAILAECLAECAKSQVQILAREQMFNIRCKDVLALPPEEQLEAMKKKLPEMIKLVQGIDSEKARRDEWVRAAQGILEERSR